MLTAEHSDKVSLGNTQHCRVLLASRSELICFTVQNILQNSEFLVNTAGTIEETVQLLRTKKYDAVIAELCTDAEEGIRLRQEVRVWNEKLPFLFLTPIFYWSDVSMLDRIVEDPHSYYIPENADRAFMLAKIRQVFHSYQAENALNSLQAKITRNWFLASLLQQAMLPPWVHFSNSYEFSCFYRPFTRVSGDLFEWLPLDDNRALFIFGDVSGHGTHSALAMTAVQTFLKQIILFDKEKARAPHIIAAEINTFFCTHLHNIVCMSTLIAYIDFKNNYLCYQNAGYMDIIAVDAANGQLLEINPEKKGNLPLGMMRETVYTKDDNVECHFSDSTVFLFFSDGLMDLSKDPEGTQYMDMDMCKRLASLLIADAQKEEKSIALPFLCYHSLEQFGYIYPQDDLSMVLLRKPLKLEREYIFSCHVPADKAAVDQICEKVSAFVMNFYNDEKLAVDTELLLEEYLVNVILHGLNEYEKLNEHMAVKLCAYEHELRIIIWDHGKEWNGLMTHDGNVDEILDGLNERWAVSGRGLPIIRKIASHISRQRYSGLNESVFIIPREMLTKKEAPDNGQ